LKTPTLVKVAEAVCHVTGVSTILRPVWNEYKECKTALERSERELAKNEAERRRRK
jgi:hypothetical protein